MELLPAVFYFLAALFGMLAHFLKKKIKKESATEIVNYFRDNVRSTLLAFMATVVGFIILVQTGQVSFASAFLAGYMCDSAFNKWESGNDKA